MKLYRIFLLCFFIFIVCLSSFSCADISGTELNTISSVNQPSEPTATATTAPITEEITEAMTTHKDPGIVPWNSDNPIFSFPSSTMTEEEMYAEVKKGGWFVIHNGFVMAGKDLWDSFYSKVLSGEPAIIYIAKYYTPTRTVQMSEELLKHYPDLTLIELSYDGTSFKIMCRAGEYDFLDLQAEYKYIVTYKEPGENSTAIYGTREVFYLVNSEDLTPKIIEEALIMGTFVPDALEIYSEISDIKDEYTDLIPSE